MKELILWELHKKKICEYYSCSDLEDKQYLCGICRLLRFEIIKRIISSPTYHLYNKIRATIDGTSLSKSNYCSDFVDLDSLASNDLISSYPIFTPVVGFGKRKIKEIVSKISPNLKKIDYCPFKPENQKFDAESVREIYDTLKIDDILEASIKKGRDLRI